MWPRNGIQHNLPTKRRSSKSYFQKPSLYHMGTETERPLFRENPGQAIVGRTKAGARPHPDETNPARVKPLVGPQVPLATC